MTTSVACQVCCRFGKSTLASSPRTSPVNAKSPRTPPRIPPLRSMSPPDWLLGLPAMGAVTVRRPACRFRRDAEPWLARLLMGRMPPAEAAILRELDPVRRVPLRLLRLVVAPLAVLARQRNQHADTGLSHWGRLLGSRAPGPAPIRQDTRDPRRATPSAGAADARLDRRPNPPRVPPSPARSGASSRPTRARRSSSHARAGLAARRRADALDDAVGRARSRSSSRRRPGRALTDVDGDRVRRPLPRRHRRDDRPRARRRSPRRSRSRRARGITLDAADRGRDLGRRGAGAPLRPAALAVRADRDRRQPVRAPARPARSPAARRSLVHQLVLPRHRRRDVRRRSRRRHRVPAATTSAPPVDAAVTTRRGRVQRPRGARAARWPPATSPACLIEPALTNIGIVLPDPGYHEAVRELTRRHGTLLVIDETHTLCAGPGGYTPRLRPRARLPDGRQADRERRPGRGVRHDRGGGPARRRRPSRPRPSTSAASAARWPGNALSLRGDARHARARASPTTLRSG